MTTELVVDEAQHQLHTTDEVCMPPPEESLGSAEYPPIIIKAPRQRIGPDYNGSDKKLSGIETADGYEADELVKKGVVPDSLFVGLKGDDSTICTVDTESDKNQVRIVDPNGEIKIFAELEYNDSPDDKPNLRTNQEVMDEIAWAFGAPRAPWGPAGLMDMDFINKRHAFYDGPYNLEKNRYRLRAGFGDYFSKNLLIPNTTVGWGQCYGEDITGPNLKSVNFTHGHLTQYGVKLDHTHIRNIRENSPWDGGISAEFANHEIEHLRPILRDFLGREPDLRSDRMGLTVLLPIQPKDMAEPDYIRLERRVGLCMDAALREEHEFLYGTDYTQTVRLSERAHDRGVDDEWWNEFNNIFHTQPYNTNYEFSKDTYRKLIHLTHHQETEQQGIKRPFGWAYGLAFNPEGCMATITWGVRNHRGIGPTEGLGGKLVRLNELKSQQEMQNLKNYYLQGADYAMANFIRQ